MCYSKCVIKNTHRRLNDVHRLIHQTVDNYFCPEGFRVNLNSTIQELRNLTFTLQAEKGDIGPDFKPWYEEWRNKMANDPLMNWLNKSRVTIVHKKDLESKSIAKVKVYTYEEVFTDNYNIPIDLSNEDIVEFLIDKDVINPITHKLNMMIRIERCWVEETLPEFELIDVLVHCFKVLRDLVIDAHEKFGVNFNDCEIKDSLHECSFINGKLACIEEFNIYRAIELSAKDFSIREIVIKSCSYNEEIVKKTVNKYNIKSFMKSVTPRTYSLDSYFDSLIEQSKIVLQTDKYHNPMAFLMSENKPIKLIQLTFEDKSSKFMNMSKLAEEVESLDANAVITIMESWISQDVEGYLKEGSLENIENKRECLVLSLFKNDSSQKHVSIFFRRNFWGRIIFEEITETSSNNTFYFKPILKVWGLE